MRIKKLLLASAIVALALLGFSANAGNVDVNAARMAAKNFFNEYSYSPLMPEAVYYLVLNNFEYAKKSVERKKAERFKACLEACERMERDYKDSKYYKETAKIAQEAQKHLQKLQAKS